MELQKSMGSVEKSIENLGGKLDSQSTSIDRIKYILAFAAGAVFVASVILSYVIDKKFDAILSVLSN